MLAVASGTSRTLEKTNELLGHKPERNDRYVEIPIWNMTLRQVMRRLGGLAPVWRARRKNEQNNRPRDGQKVLDNTGDAPSASRSRANDETGKSCTDDRLGLKKKLPEGRALRQRHVPSMQSQIERDHFAPYDFLPK